MWAFLLYKIYPFAPIESIEGNDSIKNRLTID